MPQVVLAAAVGAGLGAAGAFTAFAIGGSFVLGGAVVFGGLALAAHLLAPEPPDFGNLAADTRRTIRTPVANARWVLGRARVGGVLAYYLEPESEDRDVHFVMVLAEGPVDGIEKMWVEGEEVPWRSGGASSAKGNVMPSGAAVTPIADHEYDGHMTVRAYYNGGRARALEGVEGSQWTAAHQLTGKCFVHVHLQQSDYGNDTDKRVWYNLPNIEFLVKGQKISWPGQAEKRWTENAAAIRYWWLTERRGVPASAIDTTDFNAAFAYCNGRVNNALAANYVSAGYPATSPRYTINGVVRSSDPHDRVESEMDFAWAGAVVEISGTHRFKPGRDRNPAATITDAEILKRHSVQPAPALTDRVNAMTMRLAQSSSHDYTEVALPEFVDTEGMSRDGRKLPKDLQSRPFVCCPVSGGRLMATMVRRARAQKIYSIRITPGANLERLNLIPTDIVTFSDSALGIENARCMIMQRAINEDWSIDLVLEQSLAGTFADTTVLPPLFGDGLNYRGLLAPPNAPTGVTVTAAVSVTDDGAAKSVISVGWDASPHETHIVINGPSEQRISNISQNLTVTGVSEDIIVPYPGTYTVDVSHINNRGIHSDAVRRTVTVSWADLPIGGQRWISGTGTPTAAIGHDGDFYLNKDDGNLFEKRAGAWVLISNVDAADGSKWYTGTTDPPNTLGNDGDWYLKISVETS